MLSGSAWVVHFGSRDLSEPVTVPFFLRDQRAELVGWLDEAGLPDGLPFLLSPRFEYDVALNAYFLQAKMLSTPWNSNANRARALARFLNFPGTARGGKGWREATETDHLAFHQWRRWDEAGPRVEGSTWNQEVSLVNQFYAWAVRQGHVAAAPIPHRDRRPPPAGTVWPASAAGTVPAAYAHDENGERIERMPPAIYRLWRDVGLRGYTRQGLPHCDFGAAGRHTQTFSGAGTRSAPSLPTTGEAAS